WACSRPTSVLLKNAADATQLKYLRLEVDRIVDCGTASNLRHTYDPALFIAMLTGWINRHRQQDMTYLQEAHRLLKVQRVGCRRPLADTARRRLTAWPYLLSCTLGTDVASIARSDSLMPCLTVSRPDGAPALLPERCRQTAACPWGQCAGKPAP